MIEFRLVKRYSSIIKIVIKIRSGGVKPNSNHKMENTFIINHLYKIMNMILNLRNNEYL